MSSSSEEEKRWAYLNALDQELLIGNAICSEWATFLVRDADTAYCAGSHLGAIFAAVAGIEAQLRYEYFPSEGQRMTLFEVINQAPLAEDLRRQLHVLRRFRNSWAHVSDPLDDAHLLERPEVEELAIEVTAHQAMRLLREVLYLEQGT